MKMSSEVEIIEDGPEIIELTDDMDEDSEDVIVINYVKEDAAKENKADICIIVDDEHEELPILINENVSNHDKDKNIKCRTNELLNSYNRNVLNTSIVNSRKRKRKQRRLARIRNMKTVQNSKIGNGELNKVSKSSTSNENCNEMKNVLENTNENSNEIKTELENCHNNNEQNNEGNEVGIPNSIANEEPNNSGANIQNHDETTEKCSNSYDYSKLKWLKPLNNLSSPPHLQIVIIDRSHQDWRISTDKWLMIEKRLLEALNNEMLRTNDTSIGLFDGAKWHRGIKIVGCHNEKSFNFISKFILNLDKLWNGAKLEVFPITEVTRHVVKVFIPPPILKTELMLSLIKLQNPTICSEDWKVLKERERANNGGVDIWFSVNDQSFTHISRLRGEIKYGINRIWIKPSFFHNA